MACMMLSDSCSEGEDAWCETNELKGEQEAMRHMGTSKKQRCSARTGMTQNIEDNVDNAKAHRGKSERPHGCAEGGSASKERQDQ